VAGHKDNTNIHRVTAADPAFLFHCGEGVERHRLPVDTRVIYPNSSVASVPDTNAAIEHALDHPLGTEPLAGHLKSGMKVTIAFDDVSLPLPPMQKPDIRQRIIEILLDRLERAGVTDIELICAICLHRRVTPAEMKHFVGPSVFKRFWPDRLYNHDAEDPDGNTYLGTTDEGEDVEINRRAVESDLLIYVNINLVTMDGGHKSVPVGLATYKSVRHHHNAHMMLHDSSYMDPPASPFHRSCERMGAIVAKHLKIFAIETVLNGDTFSHLLGFMQKREHTWNLRDRLTYHGMSTGLKMVPFSIRRRLYGALPAPYGLAAVNAGDTEQVHVQTLREVDRVYNVDVDGQADILILGLPSIGPYNVNSILNPILVQCMSAGYFFNFYRGRPLLRKGGVMIVVHPIHEKFHMVHHPSYYDFYHDCLPVSRDPVELEKRFEKSFAENERYRDLYRHSHAYHGVHPFYMWYWGAHGMAHCGKIISVNPASVRAAQRIGFDVAPSFTSALGMANDFAGPDAKMTYFHCPPIIMANLQ